ncbi:MAG: phosphatase PAP2 family protein [Chloroflexi bacterium]|nr:phosphatase PAP2 family protein [Chloroflexota bacterium]
MGHEVVGSEVAIPDTRGRLRLTTLASITGFAVFALLVVLVHARVFARLDWTVARALARWRFALFEWQPSVWQLLDLVSSAVTVVLSAELAVLYALVASALLWRASRGRWSLAPLAFVLLVPIEMNLKLLVDQPLVRPAPHGIRHAAPRDRPTISYPFTTVSLRGAFPSGHATRTGFLCTFLAVVLWQRGGWAKRLGIPGLMVVAALFGFTRVYVRDHWPMDVVAGLVSGGALALLVAPPVARAAPIGAVSREAEPPRRQGRQDEPDGGFLTQ